MKAKARYQTTLDAYTISDARAEEMWRAMQSARADGHTSPHAARFAIAASAVVALTAVVVYAATSRQSLPVQPGDDTPPVVVTGTTVATDTTTEQTIETPLASMVPAPTEEMSASTTETTSVKATSTPATEDATGASTSMKTHILLATKTVTPEKTTVEENVTSPTSGAVGHQTIVEPTGNPTGDGKTSGAFLPTTTAAEPYEPTATSPHEGNPTQSAPNQLVVWVEFQEPVTPDNLTLFKGERTGYIIRSLKELQEIVAKDERLAPLVARFDEEYFTKEALVLVANVHSESVGSLWTENGSLFYECCRIITDNPCYSYTMLLVRQDAMVGIDNVVFMIPV